MAMLTSSPKRMRACLVQYNGDSLGKRFPLDLSKMILGRSPRASIVIHDPSISRIHAEAYRNGTQIDIEDLDSVNGTFVNDQKLSDRRTLHDGDLIRLGTVLFKYFAHDNIENAFHDKIYRLKTIDALTHTFNKGYLQETLDSEFKYAKTYNQPLSVFYFDLDFFKKVNDTYGHAAGDAILKETATRVKAHLREEDILCRFGGEEFVVILPGTDQARATQVAENVRRAMEAASFAFPASETETIEIQQLISGGVSQMNEQMASYDQLLHDADQKLYQSKTNGRNQITS